MVHKYYLKEKVTPESFTFWSSPIASKHPTFPLTEVSVCEMPAILKKFVSTLTKRSLLAVTFSFKMVTKVSINIVSKMKD